MPNSDPNEYQCCIGANAFLWKSNPKINLLVGGTGLQVILLSMKYHTEQRSLWLLSSILGAEVCFLTARVPQTSAMLITCLSEPSAASLVPLPG